MQSALARLVNEIADTGLDWVPVLDDLHLITEPAINDSLVFVLGHVPPQMHLILTTRADPPWPLARLRVRGDMTKLRTEDLLHAGRGDRASEHGDGTGPIGSRHRHSRYAHRRLDRGTLAPLADPLSECELDVLRLLPTSLTSIKIAQELYIPKNMVRSHIAHIYGKLDVHSRVQAVQRAQEPGIL